MTPLHVVWWKPATTCAATDCNRNCGTPRPSCSALHSQYSCSALQSGAAGCFTCPGKRVPAHWPGSSVAAAPHSFWQIIIRCCRPSQLLPPLDGMVRPLPAGAAAAAAARARRCCIQAIMLDSLEGRYATKSPEHRLLCAMPASCIGCILVSMMVPAWVSAVAKGKQQQKCQTRHRCKQRKGANAQRSSQAGHATCSWCQTRHHNNATYVDHLRCLCIEHPVN